MISPPFLNKYKNNPYVYWFLWAFVVTYVSLVIVWIVIFVQNTSFVYTWFKTPGLPGAALTSLRGSFTSISLRFAIVIHPWVPFFIMTMIAYRSNAVLSIGAFGCVCVGFILCFFAMAVLADSYSHCNGQEQFGNICNDPLWCCVSEIRANVANGCPNTIDCDPPLSFDDVNPNGTFLGLFWMHVVMTILQGLYIVITAYVWSRPAPVKTEKEEQEEEEEEEELQKEEIPMPAVTTALAQQLVGGLSNTTTRRKTTHRLK